MPHSTADATTPPPSNDSPDATHAASVDRWREMHRDGYFQDHRKYQDRFQMRGVDRLLELLEPDRDDDLLEIGCGYGRLIYRLAPLVNRVTGVDVAPEPIEDARSFLAGFRNVDLKQTNGVDLSVLPDASFDGVWSVTVFQHLPRAAVERYFDETRRVLRPGGRLCFQFMTGGDTEEDIRNEAKEQSVSWSAAQIASLAERRRFIVRRLEFESVKHHPQFDWYWILADHEGCR